MPDDQAVAVSRRAARRSGPRGTACESSGRNIGGRLPRTPRQDRLGQGHEAYKVADGPEDLERGSTRSTRATGDQRLGPGPRREDPASPGSRQNNSGTIDEPEKISRSSARSPARALRSTDLRHGAMPATTPVPQHRDGMVVGSMLSSMFSRTTRRLPPAVRDEPARTSAIRSQRAGYRAQNRAGSPSRPARARATAARRAAARRSVARRQRFGLRRTVRPFVRPGSRSTREARDDRDDRLDRRAPVPRAARARAARARPRRPDRTTPLRLGPAPRGVARVAPAARGSATPWSSRSTQPTTPSRSPGVTSSSVGDAAFAVRLSAFLDRWLPRLPADGPLVRSMCNYTPPRSARAAIVRCGIRWARWPRGSTWTPDGPLVADGWRQA